MGKIVRRRFDRTVVKKCPECKKQIPVACKSCPACGHQFSTSKLKSPVKSGQEQEDNDSPSKRRRTKRTKRERPDFFNPLDRRFKRERKRKEIMIDDSPRKKRGRPKGSIMPKKEEEKETKPPVEVDVFADLPSEKALQFSIILAEINRKFTFQKFCPT
ncbi:hypothetical protein CHS0354_024905 [Potamilus streckersoni]|uniref:UPF0547 domain-containing protein n=1 Tax=Potamilus streckersoni TaxID=2493646 RepID=A0AAE0VYB5_9BIVA|nr:hypothetical protein CHS0354_024905 [Potamilus streckersoni]